MLNLRHARALCILDSVDEGLLLSQSGLLSMITLSGALSLCWLFHIFRFGWDRFPNMHIWWDCSRFWHDFGSRVLECRMCSGWFGDGWSSVMIHLPDIWRLFKYRALWMIHLWAIILHMWMRPLGELWCFLKFNIANHIESSIISMSLCALILNFILLINIFMTGFTREVLLHEWEVFITVFRRDNQLCFVLNFHKSRCRSFPFNFTLWWLWYRTLVLWWNWCVALSLVDDLINLTWSRFDLIDLLLLFGRWNCRLLLLIVHGGSFRVHPD